MLSVESVFPANYALYAALLAFSLLLFSTGCTKIRALICIRGIFQNFVQTAALGQDKELTIDAFGWSLMSGKVYARIVTFQTKSAVVRIRQIIATWRWSESRVIENPHNDDEIRSLPFRLDLVVKGVEIYLHNSPGRYEALRTIQRKQRGLGEPGFADSSSETEGHESGKQDVDVSGVVREAMQGLVDRIARKTPAFYEWFPCVRVQVEKGAVLIGNRRLPHFFVFQFDKALMLHWFQKDYVPKGTGAAAASGGSMGKAKSSTNASGSSASLISKYASEHELGSTRNSVALGLLGEEEQLELLGASPSDAGAEAAVASASLIQAEPPALPLDSDDQVRAVSGMYAQWVADNPLGHNGYRGQLYSTLTEATISTWQMHLAQHRTRLGDSEVDALSQEMDRKTFLYMMRTIYRDHRHDDAVGKRQEMLYSSNRFMKNEELLNRVQSNSQPFFFKIAHGSELSILHEYDIAPTICQDDIAWFGEHIVDAASMKETKDEEQKQDRKHQSSDKRSSTVGFDVVRDESNMIGISANGLSKVSAPENLLLNNLDIKVNGSQFQYSAWADAQKNGLVRDFLPFNYEVPPLHKRVAGEYFWSRFFGFRCRFFSTSTDDCSFNFSYVDSTPNNPFSNVLLAGRKNRHSVVAKFGDGSQIDYCMEMLACGEKYRQDLSGKLRQVRLEWTEMSISEPIGVFEEVSLDCRLPFMRSWNSMHHWEFDINLSKGSLVYLSNFFNLFSGMAADFARFYVPFPLRFHIPFSMQYNISLQRYHIRCSANEYNCIGFEKSSIDWMSDTDHVVWIDLYGRESADLSVILGYTRYESPAGSLSYSVNFPNVELSFEFPRTSAYQQCRSLAGSESLPFLRTRQFRVDGNMVYYVDDMPAAMVESSEGLDVHRVRIFFDQPSLCVSGHVVRYMMSFLNAYYGANSGSICNINDFTKHCAQNVASAVAWESWLVTHNAQTDLYLEVSDATCFLPNNLHFGNELHGFRHMGRPRVRIPFMCLDMTSEECLFDLSLAIRDVTLHIPVSKVAQSAEIHPVIKSMQSSTHFVIESVDLNMQSRSAYAPIVPASMVAVGEEEAGLMNFDDEDEFIIGASDTVDTVHRSNESKKVTTTSASSKLVLVSSTMVCNVGSIVLQLLPEQISALVSSISCFINQYYKCTYFSSQMLGGVGSNPYDILRFDIDSVLGNKEQLGAMDKFTSFGLSPSLTSDFSERNITVIRNHVATDILSAALSNVKYEFNLEDVACTIPFIPSTHDICDPETPLLLASISLDHGAQLVLDGIPFYGHVNTCGISSRIPSLQVQVAAPSNKLADRFRAFAASHSSWMWNSNSIDTSKRVFSENFVGRNPLSGSSSLFARSTTVSRSGTNGGPGMSDTSSTNSGESSSAGNNSGISSNVSNPVEEAANVSEASSSGPPSVSSGVQGGGSRRISVLGADTDDRFGPQAAPFAAALGSGEGFQVELNLHQARSSFMSALESVRWFELAKFSFSSISVDSRDVAKNPEKRASMLDAFRSMPVYSSSSTVSNKNFAFDSETCWHRFNDHVCYSAVTAFEGLEEQELHDGSNDQYLRNSKDGSSYMDGNSIVPMERSLISSSNRFDLLKRPLESGGASLVPNIEVDSDTSSDSCGTVFDDVVHDQEHPLDNTGSGSGVLADDRARSTDAQADQLRKQFFKTVRPRWLFCASIRHYEKWSSLAEVEVHDFSLNSCGVRGLATSISGGRHAQLQLDSSECINRNPFHILPARRGFCCCSSTDRSSSEKAEKDCRKYCAMRSTLSQWESGLWNDSDDRVESPSDNVGDEVISPSTAVDSSAIAAGDSRSQPNVRDSEKKFVLSSNTIFSTAVALLEDSCDQVIDSIHIGECEAHIHSHALNAADNLHQCLASGLESVEDALDAMDSIFNSLYNLPPILVPLLLKRSAAYLDDVTTMDTNVDSVLNPFDSIFLSGYGPRDDGGAAALSGLTSHLEKEKHELSFIEQICEKRKRETHFSIGSLCASVRIPSHCSMFRGGSILPSCRVVQVLSCSFHHFAFFCDSMFAVPIIETVEALKYALTLVPVTEELRRSLQHSLHTLSGLDYVSTESFQSYSREYRKSGHDVSNVARMMRTCPWHVRSKALIANGLLYGWGDGMRRARATVDGLITQLHIAIDPTAEQCDQYVPPVSCHQLLSDIDVSESVDHVAVQVFAADDDAARLVESIGDLQQQASDDDSEGIHDNSTVRDNLFWHLCWQASMSSVVYMYSTSDSVSDLRGAHDEEHSSLSFSEDMEATASDTSSYVHFSVDEIDSLFMPDGLQSVLDFVQAAESLTSRLQQSVSIVNRRKLHADLSILHVVMSACIEVAKQEDRLLSHEDEHLLSEWIRASSAGFFDPQSANRHGVEHEKHSPFDNCLSHTSKNCFRTMQASPILILWRRLFKMGSPAAKKAVRSQVSAIANSFHMGSHSASSVSASDLFHLADLDVDWISNWNESLSTISDKVSTNALQISALLFQACASFASDEVHNLGLSSLFSTTGGKDVGFMLVQRFSSCPLISSMPSFHPLIGASKASLTSVSSLATPAGSPVLHDHESTIVAHIAIKSFRACATTAAPSAAEALVLDDNGRVVRSFLSNLPVDSYSYRCEQLAASGMQRVQVCAFVGFSNFSCDSRVFVNIHDWNKREKASAMVLSECRISDKETLSVHWDQCISHVTAKLMPILDTVRAHVVLAPYVLGRQKGDTKVADTTNKPDRGLAHAIAQLQSQRTLQRNSATALIHVSQFDRKHTFALSCNSVEVGFASGVVSVPASGKLILLNPSCIFSKSVRPHAPPYSSKAPVSINIRESLAVRLPSSKIGFCDSLHAEVVEDMMHFRDVTLSGSCLSTCSPSLTNMKHMLFGVIHIASVHCVLGSGQSRRLFISGADGSKQSQVQRLIDLVHNLIDQQNYMKDVMDAAVSLLQQETARASASSNAQTKYNVHNRDKESAFVSPFNFQASASIAARRIAGHVQDGQSKNHERTINRKMQGWIKNQKFLECSSWALCSYNLSTMEDFVTSRVSHNAEWTQNLVVSCSPPKNSDESAVVVVFEHDYLRFRYQLDKWWLRYRSDSSKSKVGIDERTLSFCVGGKVHEVQLGVSQQVSGTLGLPLLQTQVCIGPVSRTSKELQMKGTVVVGSLKNEIDDRTMFRLLLMASTMVLQIRNSFHTLSVVVSGLSNSSLKEEPVLTLESSSVPVDLQPMGRTLLQSALSSSLSSQQGKLVAAETDSKDVPAPLLKRKKSYVTGSLDTLFDSWGVSVVDLQCDFDAVEFAGWTSDAVGFPSQSLSWDGSSSNSGRKAFERKSLPSFADGLRNLPDSMYANGQLAILFSARQSVVCITRRGVDIPSSILFSCSRLGADIRWFSSMDSHSIVHGRHSLLGSQPGEGSLRRVHLLGMLSCAIRARIVPQPHKFVIRKLQLNQIRLIGCHSTFPAMKIWVDTYVQSWKSDESRSAKEQFWTSWNLLRKERFSSRSDDAQFLASGSSSSGNKTKETRHWSSSKSRYFAGEATPPLAAMRAGALPPSSPLGERSDDIGSDLEDISSWHLEQFLITQVCCVLFVRDASLRSDDRIVKTRNSIATPHMSAIMQRQVAHRTVPRVFSQVLVTSSSQILSSRHRLGVVSFQIATIACQASAVPLTFAQPSVFAAQLQGSSPSTSQHVWDCTTSVDTSGIILEFLPVCTPLALEHVLQCVEDQFPRCVEWIPELHFPITSLSIPSVSLHLNARRGSEDTSISFSGGIPNVFGCMHSYAASDVYEFVELCFASPVVDETSTAGGAARGTQSPQLRGNASPVLSGKLSLPLGDGNHESEGDTLSDLQSMMHDKTTAPSASGGEFSYSVNFVVGGISVEVFAVQESKRLHNRSLQDKFTFAQVLHVPRIGLVLQKAGSSATATCKTLIGPLKDSPIGETRSTSSQSDNFAVSVYVCPLTIIMFQQMMDFLAVVQDQLRESSLFASSAEAPRITSPTSTTTVSSRPMSPGRFSSPDSQQVVHSSSSSNICVSVHCQPFHIAVLCTAGVSTKQRSLHARRSEFLEDWSFDVDRVALSGVPAIFVRVRKGASVVSKSTSAGSSLIANVESVSFMCRSGENFRDTPFYIASTAVRLGVTDFVHQFPNPGVQKRLVYALLDSPRDAESHKSPPVHVMQNPDCVVSFFNSFSSHCNEVSEPLLRSAASDSRSHQSSTGTSAPSEEAPDIRDDNIWEEASGLLQFHDQNLVPLPKASAKLRSSMDNIFLFHIAPIAFEVQPISERTSAQLAFQLSPLTSGQSSTAAAKRMRRRSASQLPIVGRRLRDETKLTAIMKGCTAWQVRLRNATTRSHVVCREVLLTHVMPHIAEDVRRMQGFNSSSGSQLSSTFPTSSVVQLGTLGQIVLTVQESSSDELLDHWVSMASEIVVRRCFNADISVPKVVLEVKRLPSHDLSRSTWKPPALSSVKWNPTAGAEGRVRNHLLLLSVSIDRTHINIKDTPLSKTNSVPRSFLGKHAGELPISGVVRHRQTSVASCNAVSCRWSGQHTRRVLLFEVTGERVHFAITRGGLEALDMCLLELTHVEPEDSNPLSNLAKAASRGLSGLPSVSASPRKTAVGKEENSVLDATSAMNQDEVEIYVLNHFTQWLDQFSFGGVHVKVTVVRGHVYTNNSCEIISMARHPLLAIMAGIVELHFKSSLREVNESELSVLDVYSPSPQIPHVFDWTSSRSSDDVRYPIIVNHRLAFALDALNFADTDDEADDDVAQNLRNSSKLALVIVSYEKRQRSAILFSVPPGIITFKCDSGPPLWNASKFCKQHVHFSAESSFRGRTLEVDIVDSSSIPVLRSVLAHYHSQEYKSMDATIISQLLKKKQSADISRSNDASGVLVPAVDMPVFSSFDDLPSLLPLAQKGASSISFHDLLGVLPSFISNRVNDLIGGDTIPREVYFNAIVPLQSLLRSLDVLSSQLSGTVSSGPQVNQLAEILMEELTVSRATADRVRRSTIHFDDLPLSPASAATAVTSGFTVSEEF